MKIPTNYSEWCEIFDNIEKWEIGHQDDATIKAMDQGSLKWISGVAERTTNRLLKLTNSRISKLGEFFSKRIIISCNPIELEHLLILYRKEIKFIKYLYNLEILPKELRETLTNEIINYAKSSQKNLEDNAKKDLTGLLKRIVLSNKIDNI